MYKKCLNNLKNKTYFKTNVKYIVLNTRLLQLQKNKKSSSVAVNRKSLKISSTLNKNRIYLVFCLMISLFLSALSVANLVRLLFNLNTF